MTNLKDYILQLEKSELHIHIEGSLEPSMLLHLAKRNKVDLRYSNVEQIKAAYKFKNLQNFLDLYYQGMSVLLTEEDFFDLTYAYLVKVREQNVLFAEIFFDPQAHLVRGVSFATVITGISMAIDVAREIDSQCYLFSEF